MSFTASGRVETPVLDIAYESAGRPGGTPVILLHGFPYDVRAFDGVAPILAGQGAFVLAPYLRGFGPTVSRLGTQPERTVRAAVAHLVARVGRGPRGVSRQRREPA